MKIAIAGLGYVGLPLSLQFARSSVQVVGLDIDSEKVEALNQGRSYIKHIAADAISESKGAGKFSASTDFSEVKGVAAVIICVPTPLNKNREPDISFVLNTGRAIAPHLQRGALVVLESTTYPGTTDEDLREVLETGLGYESRSRFSPRLLPGTRRSRQSEQRCRRDSKDHRRINPRLPEEGHGSLFDGNQGLVPVSSCRVAEAAKLLENIFRSVNIALVNELKQVYAAMGIDIWEVIDAAKTKPFGFMAFYPGPGLGGHCIPIDPFYLTWKAREYGKNTRFIELAGEINTEMPELVVRRVSDALNEEGKAVKGSRVLILGLAYKPNVDDERESPSYVLMSVLSERGAEVDYHDPYVPMIKPTREHSRWAGKKSVDWNRTNIASFDLVLIATNHASVNYQELGDWAQCIVDTRNAMATVRAPAGKVWKA